MVEVVLWIVNGLFMVIGALIAVQYKEKERELKKLQENIDSNQESQVILNKEILLRVEKLEIETHKIRTNYIGKFGEVRLEIRDSIGVLERSITTKFDKVADGLSRLNQLIAEQNARSARGSTSSPDQMK